MVRRIGEAPSLEVTKLDLDDRKAALRAELLCHMVAKPFYIAFAGCEGKWRLKAKGPFATGSEYRRFDMYASPYANLSPDRASNSFLNGGSISLCQYPCTPRIEVTQETAYSQLKDSFFLIPLLT